MSLGHKNAVDEIIKKNEGRFLSRLFLPLPSIPTVILKQNQKVRNSKNSRLIIYNDVTITFFAFTLISANCVIAFH